MASDSKSKAAAFRVVMKNKKMADEIFNGFDLPHGSTSSKRAVKILRTASGLTRRSINDGKGGPGNTTPAPAIPRLQPTATPAPTIKSSGEMLKTPEISAQPITTPQPSRLLSGFNAVAKMANKLTGPLGTAAEVVSGVTSIVSPKKKMEFKPGVGFVTKAWYGIDQNYEEGMKEIGDKANKGIALLSPIYGDRAAGELIKSIVAKVLTADIGVLSMGAKIPAAIGSELIRPGSGADFDWNNIIKNIQRNPFTGLLEYTGDTIPITHGAPTAPTTKTTQEPAEEPTESGLGATPSYDQASADSYFLACTEGLEACKIKTKDTTGFDPSFNAMSQYQSGTEGETTDLESLAGGLTGGQLENLVNSTLETSDTNDLDVWFNSLNEEDQKRYQPIYDAVIAGIGGDAFSYQMLGGPIDELAKAMGVDPEIVKSWPFSFTTGVNYSSLMDQARQKTQLGEWETELLNRSQSHLSAEKNFKNYIRGNDVYLKSLEKLLDDFDKQMAFADTSNESIANNMNRYRSYLTTLYGEQNQRYIGLLNDSIDQENDNYDRFKSQYDAQVSKAEKEYEGLVAGAEASYDFFSKSWQAQLAGMYDALDGKQTAADERLKAQLEIQNKAADVLSTWYDIEEKKVDIENKKLGVGTDYKGYTQGIMDDWIYQDKKEGIYSRRDPYSTLNMIMGQPEWNTSAKEAAMTSYLDSVKSDIGGMIGSGTPISTSISTYKNLVPSSTENLSEEEKALRDTYMSYIYQGTISGIDNYLGSLQSTSPDALTDVFEYVHTHPGVTPEKLKSKFSGKVSTDVLNAIAVAQQEAVKSVTDADPSIKLKEIGIFGMGNDRYDSISGAGASAIRAALVNAVGQTIANTYF